MDDTPNLKLPYIMAAQAQKHVTHNEAIRALDALVQISVADRDLTAPPESPSDGDRYIVGSGATGAWSGSDGMLAAWQDGAWMLYEPLEGWLAWVADEDTLVAWDGTAWVAAGGGGEAFTDLSDAPADYLGAGGSLAVVKADESGLEFTAEVPLLGVNTTPDATNKLAIAAEASLFNHAGNGHQHKINKNAAGDTASLLFQTGFSGRAELGTTGDDNWHVKVSADGAAWHEAIVVDKDNGYVGVATSDPLGELHVAGRAVLGGAVTSSRLASANGPRIFNMIDASAVLRVWRYNTFANSPGIELIGGTNDDAASASNSWWDIYTTTAPPNDRMSFRRRTGGTATDYLSVVAGGKVGVGTTSPSTTLHVNGPTRVGAYTVVGAPSASGAGAGAIIYVSDETGGAVLAFSDGSNWRRVTDRAVIS